jgi:hypothetical protein
MSTWTSKARAAVAALALVGLAGCEDGGLGGGGRPVTRAVAVTGGAVTIAGPAGYCIDRSATRDTGSSAFVLLGTCAALSGSPGAGQPQAPVVLTATVLDGAPTLRTMAETFPEMARFFESPAGRAALSRSGKASSVQVAQVVSLGDTLFIRASDNSPAAGEQVEPEYWRAVLAVRGRIVSLSALGLAARPLSSAAKRTVLEAFVQRVKRDNPPFKVEAATAP